jgi:hypothetical protein
MEAIARSGRKDKNMDFMRDGNPWATNMIARKCHASCKSALNFSGSFLNLCVTRSSPGSMGCPRRLPELARSDAHLVLEQATHVFRVLEPGFLGDFGDREFGLGQQAADAVQADA